MKNTLINREIIKRIAKAMGNLNDEIIYVGGAIVCLYADDPAADDIRPTKDIDISLSVATFGELENVREQLTQKGFYQSSELDIICRFHYEDIMVDVMNTKAIGWSPTNRWFKKGFERRAKYLIEETSIFIMPFTCFFASKIEAYKGRGGNDPRMSHDFEDITYLLDNRMEWQEDIKIETDFELKEYITNFLTDIKKNDLMQEAIIGNLYYETAESRLEKIMTKIDLTL